MDLGFFLFSDAQEDEPLIPLDLNPFASERDEEPEDSAYFPSHTHSYSYYDMKDRRRW